MDERKDELILESVLDENELEDVTEDMWDDMPRAKGAPMSNTAKGGDGGTGDAEGAVGKATGKQASPPPAPPPKSSWLSILVWSFVIILLLGFNALQIMGIVMHDSLEGRRDTGGVKEVFAGVNAAGSVAPLQLPANGVDLPVKQDSPKATPEPKEAPQVKESPQVKEQPKTNPPAKVAEKKVAALAAGTHVVAVGVFRSQRHVTEISRQLTEMGFPVLTEEARKKGEGFVLRFGSTQKTKIASAVKLLKGDGYIIHEGDKGPELFFHFDDKAQTAKALVGETGAKARVDSVEGKLPLWKVYAGPMDKSSAQKAVKKIKGAGLDCFLLKYKR